MQTVKKFDAFLELEQFLHCFRIEMEAGRTAAVTSVMEESPGSTGQGAR